MTDIFDSPRIKCGALLLGLTFFGDIVPPRAAPDSDKDIVLNGLTTKRSRLNQLPLTSIVLALFFSNRLYQKEKQKILLLKANNIIKHQQLDKHHKIGLILCLLGFVFRTWCKLCLKNSFTYAISVKPNQKVVDYGPYSLIRHPSYLGMFTIMIGNVIYWDYDILFCSLAALLLIMFVKKIALEEEFLLNLKQSSNDKDRIEFAKQYKEYINKTRFRLIPFCY